jgi:N-acetylneuraminic acid mutarotase
VGGVTTDSKVTGAFDFYRFEDKEWQKNLPLLSIGRAACGVGIVQNKLYVVGGGTGYESIPQDSIAEIEMCSLDQQPFQWQPGPKLNTAGLFGMGVLTDDRYLYVIGGFEGSAVTTTQIYDVTRGRWLQNVPAMQQARGWLGIVKYKQQIYAIGGSISQNEICSV